MWDMFVRRLYDDRRPHPSGKGKTFSDNVNLHLSSFLAAEGKEEAVTPLWEVGGSPKACGKEPRPSVNAPCSSLLSFRGRTIIKERKQGGLSFALLLENCMEFCFYLIKIFLPFVALDFCFAGSVIV